MGVVGVKINNKGKIYFYDNNNLMLKKDFTVIVDTDKGFQFAQVCMVDVDNDVNLDDGKIIRLTNKKDYTQYLSNIKDAKNAIKKCRDFVSKLGIDMNIIDAEYTFTRNQLLFRFMADDRVDFRELARELGSHFKTRIELRQIGVRDKAKEVGGVGPCGKKLCCNSFLSEFDSVSINMAKNQSLSLNPSKINGVCGRLLCCLKYENDSYTKAKKNLLNVGDEVNINNIKGKILSVDVLNRKYKILSDNNVIVEMDVKDGSKK